MSQSPYRQSPGALPHDRWPIEPTLLSGTPELPGWRILQSFGIAHGFGHQPAGMRLGVALEHRVAEAYEAAWSTAVYAMMRRAADSGANGLVGVRFELTTWSDGFPVVLASGTAVRVVPET